MSERRTCSLNRLLTHSPSNTLNYPNTFLLFRFLFRLLSDLHLRVDKNCLGFFVIIPFCLFFQEVDMSDDDVALNLLYHQVSSQGSD